MLFRSLVEEAQVMPDSRQIPGFTPEQTWALKALIREGVREANDHDERVAALQECVFGNGKEGLKTTIVRMQKDVGSLVWWYRLLVGAVVGSWLTLLVSFLR